MRSLHVENVTFAAATKEMIDALHQPNDCPTMAGKLDELFKYTKDQVECDIVFEPPGCNKVSLEIAKSVVKELRLASYVAVGGPRWLEEVIEGEKPVIVV